MVGKNRKKKFNPDREYIRVKTEEFLKSGGVIKKVEPDFSLIPAEIRRVNVLDSDFDLYEY